MFTLEETFILHFSGTSSKFMSLFLIGLLLSWISCSHISRDRARFTLRNVFSSTSPNLQHSLNTDTIRRSRSAPTLTSFEQAKRNVPNTILFGCPYLPERTSVRQVRAIWKASEHSCGVPFVWAHAFRTVENVITDGLMIDIPGMEGFSILRTIPRHFLALCGSSLLAKALITIINKQI